MKKTSTVATRSNKNLHGKLTIGFDLSDRPSWYYGLDEAGEVIGEQKLGTAPKAMKEAFAAMLRSRVASETGTHSPYLAVAKLFNKSQQMEFIFAWRFL
jgi:transposase